MKFKDQVSIITGASSGIGRATAIAFGREGAKVVVSDMNEAGGLQTVELIEAAGGTAVFVECNVTDNQQVERLIKTTVDTFGRIDNAINNAGVGGSLSRITEVSWQEYQHVMNVNLGGVFLCMQHQIRQMLTQGGGKIVNVSSVAGLRGLPNSSVYSASKHAVVGLTKSVAMEYVRKNIRVNAVCPVFTRSAMVDSLFEIDPTYEEKLKRNIPMGRYGQPEDISQAILWLCADENSFLTGHALPMDGGMMA